MWLWRDWPGRAGKPDTGIDLVAERADGGITAIQCKFYAENHTMQTHDIDSFTSASGKKPFTHRLVVSTTANWSKNAEEMLDSQHLPVTASDTGPRSLASRRGGRGHRAEQALMPISGLTAAVLDLAAAAT